MVGEISKLCGCHGLPSPPSRPQGGQTEQEKTNKTKNSKKALAAEAMKTPSASRDGNISKLGLLRATTHLQTETTGLCA